MTISAYARGASACGSRAVGRAPERALAGIGAAGRSDLFLARHRVVADRGFDRLRPLHDQRGQSPIGNTTRLGVLVRSAIFVELKQTSRTAKRSNA